jgi:hypothetical protein
MACGGLELVGGAVTSLVRVFRGYSPSLPLSAPWFEFSCGQLLAKKTSTCVIVARIRPGRAALRAAAHTQCAPTLSIRG